MAPRLPRLSPLFTIILAAALAAGRGRILEDSNVEGRLLLALSPAPSPQLIGAAAASGGGGCEETYGFMPCTTKVVGNLFLVLAYGLLMYKAATYLSSGSELLLEVIGPGIIGGLFLPILGAIPDALLILVSGLSGSKEAAQSQVLIGMGLLAGSTVMLLTVLWGTCVVIGKCDLSAQGTAIDSQDTKKFSLVGSGVTTDNQTSYSARIMSVSIVAFIIVQFPQIVKSPDSQHTAVLVALILAATLVLSYCLYQVLQPWVQKRRLAYAKHKHVISGILRYAQMQALGKLFNDDGTPSESAIKKLFNTIDQDHSGTVSSAELRALLLGIQFEDIDLDKNEAAEKIMSEFDTSGNRIIEENEFIQGMTKWLKVARHNVVLYGPYNSSKFFNEFFSRTREQHDCLLSGMSDEVVESVENPGWNIAKAVFLLLLGTVVAAAFADPLVDSVTAFSQASKIPSFFISFIFMPLATNSSEAVSSIIFASRKKLRTTSLTFSEIYGAATMNNTLCLAVFLALVYVRELQWDFSSEVLVILIVVVIMGLFASFRTTFPLWTCFLAYLLYPLALVIVYVLDYIVGWS